MWLAWLFAVLLAVVLARYVTKGVSSLNSFSKPFGVFAAGMFLIPALICGGLRFWICRIRNPWLALLPFLIGVFFAWHAVSIGLFLFPEFYVVFKVLSVVLFAIYLPLFVRLRPATPNDETAKA